MIDTHLTSCLPGLECHPSTVARPRWTAGLPAEIRKPDRGRVLSRCVRALEPDVVRRTPREEVRADRLLRAVGVIRDPLAVGRPDGRPVFVIAGHERREPANRAPATVNLNRST